MKHSTSEERSESCHKARPAVPCEAFSQEAGSDSKLGSARSKPCDARSTEY